MIIKQVITEKASDLLQNNCYTFIVNDNANSISLRQYIEKKYDVSVKKVNITKHRSKKVRRGRIKGHTTEYKKAYVFANEEIKAFTEGS